MVDAGAMRGLYRILHRHSLRVAEIKPLARFGDNNRGAAVGCEVHIVGVIDRNILPRFAGYWIDGCHAAVVSSFSVIIDPESFQIPGRNNVLRMNADTEFVDDFIGRRIDHPDIVRTTVRHINAREVFCHCCAQLVRPRLAVDIVRIDDRRHSRHGLNPARGSNCR